MQEILLIGIALLINMIRLFHEINNNRTALIALVDVNIKTTVASTRLGWLWWVINPLVMMGIYYFLVNIILGRGGENYHIFILTGLIAWQSFSNGLMGTVNVIINNSQLIRQVALPISMLIAIPILVQLFFNSIGIIIILIWNYPATGFHSLAVVPLLLLVGILVYGLGLFLSVLNVYIKDTKEIVSYLLRAGFFLTPILFPVTRVTESPRLPEIAKALFSLNPMTWIINAFRQILLEGQMFNWSDYFVILCISMFIVQIGLFWLRANSSQIIKML